MPTVYTHYMLAERNDCDEIRTRLGISGRCRLDCIPCAESWTVKEVQVGFTELSQGWLFEARVEAGTHLLLSYRHRYFRKDVEYVRTHIYQSRQVCARHEYN